MLPEIKKLWIEALRSGEYKQQVGSLRRTSNGQECFCALGVLCEVALKHGVKDLHRGPQKGYYVGPTANDNCENYALPKPVREWAQTDTIPYIIMEEDEFGRIRDMKSIPACNDKEALSFEQIADLLEEKKIYETRD